MTGEEKKRILAVDDESLILRMIVRQLGKFYNVEPASNAEEAMEIIDKQRSEFDLVLTDLDMVNRGDGAKVIRAGKEAGIEHLVVMSGRAGEPGVDSAMREAGATLIIQKPAEDLVKTIRTTLGNVQPTDS